MGKKLDVAGQRFGKLTAIAPVGTNAHGWVLWETVCDCGTKKTVPLPSLRQGTTRSCGCLRVESWRDRPEKNIQGDTFLCSGCDTRLPLTQKAKSRGVYKCLACIKEYRKTLYHANPEKSREKAKTYREQNPEKMRAQSRVFRERHPEKKLWAAAKARAEKRGMEFTLTLEDIVIPEFCPVLGIRLDVRRNPESKRGFPEYNSPTIDRKDNNKGYVPGNITIMSWRANSLKKDGSREEIRLLHEWMVKEDVP